jgi:hypothetical protein
MPISFPQLIKFNDCVLGTTVKQNIVSLTKQTGKPPVKVEMDTVLCPVKERVN